MLKAFLKGPVLMQICGSQIIACIVHVPGILRSFQLTSYEKLGKI
jgi:hypothetical protein